LKKLLGQNSEDVLMAEENLANATQGLQKWGETERLMADVVSGMQKHYGKNSLYTLLSMVNHEEVRVRMGHYREGVRVFQRLASAIGRALGKNSPYVLMTRFDLADAQLSLGDAAGAAASLDGITVESLNTATPSPEWPGQLAFQKARLAQLQGDADRAQKLFKASLANLTRHEPSDFWMIVAARQQLAKSAGDGSATRTAGTPSAHTVTAEAQSPR
jgi:hypothetical protein